MYKKKEWSALVHFLLFALILPTCITFIFSKVNHEIGVAFIVCEIYLLLRIALIFGKIPDAILAISIALVLCFINHKVCIAFVLGNIDFYIRITGVLSGVNYLPV